MLIISLVFIPSGLLDSQLVKKKTQLIVNMLTEYHTDCHRLSLFVKVCLQPRVRKSVKIM